MLRSMTAFGRARRMSGDNALDITAEIKSVNSRYLDCSVRISRMYSFLEEKVKAGEKMTTSCCPAFVNMIKK